MFTIPNITAGDEFASEHITSKTRIEIWIELLIAAPADLTEEAAGVFIAIAYGYPQTNFVESDVLFWE